tara:strand:- start:513 stop:1082 length:570 start_codon:yes stop_codon:yes gene_type:complete
MISYKIPYESFIGGWFIPDKVCDKVIDYFESKSDCHFKGNVGGEKFNKDLLDDFRINITKEQMVENLFDYNTALINCLEEYKKRYEDSDRVNLYGLQKIINIQKYLPGGGYKAWHFEESGDTQKRHLVFMTFLNDVDDGGTEFKYQNLIIPAIKGLTLIWPAPWTHTHRGQISDTKTKYIITGWFNFNE